MNCNVPKTEDIEDLRSQTDEARGILSAKGGLGAMNIEARKVRKVWFLALYIFSLSISSLVFFYFNNFQTNLFTNETIHYDAVIVKRSFNSVHQKLSVTTENRWPIRQLKCLYINMPPFPPPPKKKEKKTNPPSLEVFHIWD